MVLGQCALLPGVYCVTIAGGRLVLGEPSRHASRCCAVLSLNNAAGCFKLARWCCGIGRTILIYLTAKVESRQSFLTKPTR